MSETLAAKVERLQAIRDSGMTSITVDGITQTIDQKVVAQQLRSARRQLDEDADPRPIVSQIKLT